MKKLIIVFSLLLIILCVWSLIWRSSNTRRAPVPAAAGDRAANDPLVTLKSELESTAETVTTSIAIDAQLEVNLPSTAIAGHVLGPGESVVAGALVVLSDSRLDTSWYSEMRRADQRPRNLSEKLQRFACEVDGAFRIADIAAGTYSIYAVHDDFVTSRVMTLEVIEGESYEGIRLTLRAAARLSGRVIDESGAPLSGARVEARDDINHNITEAVSQPDGSFELRGLVPDTTARLRAFLDGHAMRETRPELLGYRTDTAGIELVMVPEAIISGVVRFFDGAPCAASHVYWMIGGFHSQMALAGSAKADDAGRFELRAVPPGTLRVAARAPDEIAGPAVEPALLVAPGARIEIELILTSLAAITGVVTDDLGEPVGGLTVQGTSFDGNLGRSRTTTTSDDGRFSLDAEPGKTVQLMLRGETTCLINEWNRAGHQAAPGDFIEIVLMRGAAVHGCVVHADNTPVTEFQVSWLAWNQHNLLYRPMGMQTLSATDGCFELDGLPTEPRQLLITAAEMGRQLIDVPELKPGVRLDLGRIVLPASMTVPISGVVLASNSEPVAGAFVRAWSFEAVSGNSTRLERSGVKAGDDGTFRIDLEPGRFRLSAHSPLHPSGEREVEVLELDQWVEIKLPAGASVAGTVLGDGGQPCVGCGVTVEIYNKDGWFEMRKGMYDDPALCDEVGKYRIDGLPAGSARVVVSPRGVDSSDAWQGDHGTLHRRSITLRSGETSICDFGSGQLCHVTGDVQGWMPNRDQAIPSRVTLEGNDSVKSAQLDGENHFDLGRVLAGNYTLNVRQGDASTIGLGFSVSVVVPEGKEHALLIEAPGQSIRGRVVREDGNSPAGLWLRALTAGDFDSHIHSAPVGADGRFEIPHVPAGVYDLIGELRGFGALTHKCVVVEDGRNPADIELTLRRGGALEVETMDAAGAPIAVRMILCSDEAGHLIRTGGSTTSTRPGLLRIEGLPESTLRVVAGDDEHGLHIHDDVQVQAGATTSIKIAIGAPGPRLTVLVTHDDAPVVGAKLSMVDTRGAILPIIRGVSYEFETATAANGTAHLGRAPVGSLSVRIALGEQVVERVLSTTAGQGDIELQIDLSRE